MMSLSANSLTLVTVYMNRVFEGENMLVDSETCGLKGLSLELSMHMVHSGKL